MSEKFTDKFGMPWELVIDATAIATIREQTGVNLAGDYSLAMQQIGDGMKPNPDGNMLVRILWILCRSQAESAAITPERFALRLIDAKVYQNALDRFIQAVIAATPRKNQRFVSSAWKSAGKVA